MKQIKDIESALRLFEESAIKHAAATEQGEYKEANSSYKVLLQAFKFLEAHDEIRSLFMLLNHSSVGVRMWAATYLLPIQSEVAKKVLEEISKQDGIHSFTAKTTLSEWNKGHIQ